MSADKVQDARDAVLELIPWRNTESWPTDAEVAIVDALIAAVRADEKARCIAALEDLPSYVVPTRSAQFEIEEAIRNA